MGSEMCIRDRAMSIKVIIEFRLNMATPEANDIYESNLREFLGV